MLELQAQRHLSLVAPKQALWLDIETKKVPAPEDWPQKQRWSAFMIGTAYWAAPGKIVTNVHSGEEAEIVEYLDILNQDVYLTEFCYSATREFDEMVLRGRFTNARRAHTSQPGPWPNLNQLPVRWHNLKQVLPPECHPPRGNWDCASKDIPMLWEKGDTERIVQHCLCDVSLLVAHDPRVTRA